MVFDEELGWGVVRATFSTDGLYWYLDDWTLAAKQIRE
jgi:hypothetical protein